MIWTLLFAFGCVQLSFAQAPDILWTKTFGGEYRDGGYSVQQTTDGGYIIAGYTDSFGAGNDDVWLIKTDALGDTLWTKTFGGDRPDYGYSVQQTTDGGYFLVGWTKIMWGIEETLFIKTDSMGDTVWTKIYRAPEWTAGTSGQQTSDGGFIALGSHSDLWLIKTDTLGDTLWTKTYGGEFYDAGRSVQQTKDGGYIICGEIDSDGADDRDIWLIKTNALGDTLWTKTMGGESSDWGESVQQTTDGGYIITGETSSYGSGENDVWLIKTDQSGDTLWTKTFGGESWDKGNSVQQTDDGGYIITGSTESFGVGGDVWLIKLAADPVDYLSPNQNELPENYELYQNYPNPFNPSTIIEFFLPKAEFTTLKIYNTLGEEISTLVSNNLNHGKYTYTFDGKNLASGIYYYQLAAGEFNEVKKMILLKGWIISSRLMTWMVMFFSG
jgi:hypothetical protein